MRERSISESQVAYVLDNWQLRGIDNTSERGPCHVYFAVVPELDRAIKVAVSIHDESIVTVHLDRAATRNLRSGTRGYFVRKYQDLEERDEGVIR